MQRVESTYTSEIYYRPMMHCKTSCMIAVYFGLSFDFPCFIPQPVSFNSVNSSLGFQDVVTIDMLREAYPLLDVVDHNRRPKDSVSSFNIEAQVCDLLLTS